MRKRFVFSFAASAGLFLCFSQAQTSSSAIHEDKLLLIKKIANRNAIFEIQGGGGFYFYSAREQIGTNYRDVTYPKPFYQAEASLAVKTAPDFPLYQGPVLSMMVVPARTVPQYLVYSNNQVWNSDFNGLIFLGTYALGWRWYDLNYSKSSGWTYKMVSLSIGPSVFVHVLGNTNELRTSSGVNTETPSGTNFVSTKFGLTARAGLDFSFRDSPLHFGMHLTVSDVLAPPKNEPLLSYVFASPLAYQQIIASFQIGFGFQI